MVIKIIIVFAFILLEAGIHWFIIEKQKRDPKKDGLFTFMRTLVLVGVGIACAGAVYSYTFSAIYPILVWWGYILITRWSMFDYFLNVFRGKELFYLGNITFDDKIEAKINPILLLTLKMAIYSLATALMIGLL